MQNWHISCAVLLVALLLAGCGLKGPLYHPDASDKNPQQGEQK